MMTDIEEETDKLNNIISSKIEEYNNFNTN